VYNYTIISFEYQGEIKMDCLFCKIANGQIPSNKVYEDSMILAFHDINPEAKVHVLVIPKEHIHSVDGIDGGNSFNVSYIFEKIPQIAKSAGITNGYRVITNCGEDACQSVKHLHFHILGGEKLPEHLR
jgi:histidine triad (HIT) family protein